MRASTEKLPEHSRREAIGWLSILMFMFLYPLMFFTCVFFPVWMGWTGWTAS